MYLVEEDTEESKEEVEQLDAMSGASNGVNGTQSYAKNNIPTSINNIDDEVISS